MLGCPKRDKRQLPEFCRRHWWLVTRQPGIWKRSCSSPSAMGYLYAPYGQYGKTVTLRTLSSSLHSLNTPSAISMPKSKIRGYSPGKIQDKRLLPTHRMTKAIIQVKKTWLKDQGLSVQVTLSHVSKRLACRFGETFQQVSFGQDFPSVVFSRLERKTISAEEHCEEINISQILYYVLE